jgi:hypothetical protein
VQQGTERERLLRVAGALGRELGYEAPADGAPRRRAAGRRFPDLLTEEDEQLLGAINGALSRLAGAIGEGPDEIRGATLGALEGAELVIAAELVAGREERVAEILPGVVFLLALPKLGEAEGLRLSRRTEELLAGR